MLLRFDVHLSYTPNLLLSLFHFQNSLSTFSIERVNGIPLWDFYPSDFQRALKIIIIAELFIVKLNKIYSNNSDNAEKLNAHSRSYVLKGEGRLDLCDISLLTICKLYKHVICEVNNEINVSLTSGLGLMYTNAFTVSRVKEFVNYDFQQTHSHFRLLHP